MIKDFVGNFEATIDEKDRFVLPFKLCKCLDDGTNELFLVLSKSEDGEKYIKILDSNVFGKNINPLEIDSLRLAKECRYSRINFSATHRVQLSRQEIEWLLGEGSLQKKLTCIGLGNHIAVTKKTMEEIMNTIS